MYSIKLHFRPSKRTEGKDGKLFLRLIYHRHSGDITLPYRIDQSEWDSATNRLWPEKSSPQRRAFLQNLQKVVEREIEDLSLLVSGFKEREDLSVREIIHVYRSNKEGRGLSSFVKLLADELTLEKRDRTARAYYTTWRRLLVYSGKEEVFPEDFTGAFIKGFERLLQAEKCTLNTISFYMRNLRAIYNKGVKRGYIIKKEEQLFTDVYTRVAVTAKRALSKEEVRKLENLLADTSGKLQRIEVEALSLFLFSFHARGMSFVDMVYLKKTDIKKGKLSYFRKKTGQYIEMRLTTPMKEYIRRLNADNKNSCYLFPFIRDDTRAAYGQYCSCLRRQNQLLKQIAVKAGLQKSLSTHQARHAWATIAKKENIPVWVISEGLGHRSISTTYIYLDSFNSSVIDKAHKKVSDAVRRVG